MATTFFSNDPPVTFYGPEAAGGVSVPTGYIPFDITDPAATLYDPGGILVSSGQSGDEITVELASGSAALFPRTGVAWTRPLLAADGTAVSFPFTIPDGLLEIISAANATNVWFVWGIATGTDPALSGYAGGGFHMQDPGGPDVRALRDNADQIVDSAPLAGAFLASIGCCGLGSWTAASAMRFAYLLASGLDSTTGGTGSTAAVFPADDITTPYEFVAFGSSAALGANTSVTIKAGRASVNVLPTPLQIG